jgi:hypothetical protein
MEEDKLAILLVPLALVGFVAFWCLILKLLSLGGWSRMARSYEARSRPEGIRFGGRSARMASVNYSGSLTFIVASEGLYIAPMFLFRPAHPPLLVPWSALTATESELTFHEHPDLKMQVHASLGRELIAARKHLASGGM